MVRYNWSVIVKETKGDIDKILEYFKNIYYLDNVKEFVLRHKYAANIFISRERQENYLINVEGIVLNSLRATKEEIFVYLDLASRRDTFNYFNTKGRENCLYAWKIHDIYDLDKLKNNRLLFIEDNRIYFIYEGEV